MQGSSVNHWKAVSWQQPLHPLMMKASRKERDSSHLGLVSVWSLDILNLASSHQTSGNLGNLGSVTPSSLNTSVNWLSHKRMYTTSMPSSHCFDIVHTILEPHSFKAL